MSLNKLNIKHLLGIKQLSVSDVNLIFKTATHFKEIINRPIKKIPSLQHITIANLFFENSTRTKLSFELAEKRLSADVINFSVKNSSVNKGENILDTINNILSMKVDMVVIRHPISGIVNLLSQHISANIINAGDGTHEHPTQALLDAYSIKEKLGTIKNRNILIVGDILHSRVALSNIFVLKLLNANVKICSSKSLIPKHIEQLGVSVETNLIKALSWCDVVNVLRVQKERMEASFFPSTREYHFQYGITKEKLNAINKNIIVMHPGPINRGVEISSDVADSKQSIILNQVENGVAIRMAVIYLLANKSYSN